MDIRKLIGVAVVAAGLGMVIWALMDSGRSSRLSVDSLTVQPTSGANVILVTIDTTRADFIGSYGGPAGVTPVLDRMSEQGVLFEAAQAVAPITLPSHASMLSGLYPTEHGVRNNGMFAIPEEVETLATNFGEEGYHTGAFVSASVLSRRYGLDRGFDIYDDDLSEGLHLRQGMVPARRGDITLESALAWIDERPDDEPFFTWIHFYDPHAPYAPPLEYRRKFPSDPYSGEIAFTDSLIGRLVDYLKENGIEDNTYVTVIADHGEGLGEHGEATHALLLHQATIHVPWIIWGPGIPSGVRFGLPVSGVDVAPTLAALAGVDTPNADRSKARSVFSDDVQTQTHSLERPVYYETMLPEYQYGWKGLHGVRRGEWELVRGVRGEVFNLRYDPRELSDLADREEEIRVDLEGTLRSFGPETEDTGDEEARIELSSSEIEQLQALGYIGVDAVTRTNPPDPRDLISAHVHIEKARSFLGLNASSEAIEALDLTIEQDPTNLTALGMRAGLLLQIQEYERCQEDLVQAMSIDPSNVQPYLTMANLELAQGRFSEALEISRIAREKRGAFDRPWITEARALVGLGRMEEAEDVITKRLEERPDSPDLLATKARFLLGREDREEAERLLRHAVSIDAMHGSSRFMLANLLKNTGRRDEAVLLLEELLQIQPGSPRVIAALGEIKMDEPEIAKTYLEEAVRLDPTNGVAMVYLGQCFIFLDQPEKAEALFLRAAELIPDRMPIRNNLAVAWIMQGRAEEAEAELRDILTKRPDFTQARNNLALALIGQERYSEAERVAMRAISEDPAFVDAKLTLAEILLATDRAETIVPLLEPLSGDQQERLQFRRLLGLGYSAAGRHSDALDILESVLEETPADGPVLFACGTSSEELGQMGPARRYYERAAQAFLPGEERTAALESIERMVLKSS